VGSRWRHRNALAVLLAGTIFFSGCSMLRLQTEQERQFSEGLQALQTGNLHHAYQLLEQVVNAPPVAGMTDEALFRLALLQFSEEGGGSGKTTSRSLVLLERLQKEFPASPWTHLSTPLADWLTGSKREKAHSNQLTRENRELMRENRELRQNIERLKMLDLELEKKRKR